MSPSAKPVLQIAHLTVRLPPGGDRPNAVEDVSLEVRPGEILCMVGESGSGKSVTAHAVMGLLPKSLRVERGRILLEGENIIAARRERLRQLRGNRMAMIFQEPTTALNPLMPIGKQVQEVFRIHSDMPSSLSRERVMSLIESVGLPNPTLTFAAYPHQLSGGQRQRAMIAMALALDPALLIADEPTTALDVTTQARILELIKEIQRKHRIAVLFITHDFGVVAEIADRVAVMQCGRLVESGETDRTLTDPTHPYTHMLIASVPSTLRRARSAAPEESKILNTIKLTKIYKRGGFFGRQTSVHAMDNVNITLSRGETLGIVGESGSGKSTLARCIVRLIDPTAGAIQLLGRDISHLSRRSLRQFRKSIQIIFQDPYRSLNPRQRIGEAITEGPTNFGIPKDESLRRARRLLELVEIDPRALDRYPHQFSGGQRQRICIARALAMEPNILIADEAVSSLDVSIQSQVLDLLENIQHRFDLSIMFITHDLRVAARVCDRVAVMHNGAVIESGKVEDVFHNPQHEYTRALIASAPGRKYFGFGTAAVAGEYEDPERSSEATKSV